MNHCIFTGYLLFDPINSYEPNPSVCTFKLVTYEYKRNKRGEKKRYPTTITFQAFDSGADAIVKLGKKGMKMTIHASAKNGFMKTEIVDDILFRVNSFDFGCLDKD
ncbi:single-stranded DNA-binding protein [Crocinitomicaceae bacterium]|nr:single-stranded DNA-binding protein [Crocinitomicaceae bacterium]